MIDMIDIIESVLKFQNPKELFREIVKRIDNEPLSNTAKLQLKEWFDNFLGSNMIVIHSDLRRGQILLEEKSHNLNHSMKLSARKVFNESVESVYNPEHRFK